MTGFRIGWTIGPEEIIKSMDKIQSHSTSGASVLLQEAALGALKSGDQPIQNLKSTILDNKNILVNEIKKIKGLKLVEPGGTFYCFPNIQGFGLECDKLASDLLEKALVATVPGHAFGQEGYLRLSYTCTKDQALQAANRIRWFLDPSSPREINIGGKIHYRDWEING
jgi:aspartate/methionine/tyrosine aminotransferase